MERIDVARSILSRTERLSYARATHYRPLIFPVLIVDKESTKSRESRDDFLFMRGL